MESHETFSGRAVRYMRDLMRDFDLADFQAAAFAGNYGAETGGGKYVQEIAPTVKGSKGGLGDFQWTGMGAKGRRRVFEKLLRDNADKGWTARSYAANYTMLAQELRTTEKAALAAVRRTTTLEEATRVVCNKFERPGVLHLESRSRWARIALRAWQRAQRPPAEKSEAAPKVITDQEAIRTAQQRLRDLGYTMVGEPDGKWGRRSTAALSAFEEQASLPVTGKFTPDRQAALMKDNAPEMTVARSRAEAQPDEVAKRVPEVAESRKAEQRSLWGVITSGIASFFAFIAKQFSDVADMVRPVMEFLDNVPGWLWLSLIAVLLFFMWWPSARATRLGTAAFNTGDRV